ncbi:MAG: hypothetical protein JST16_12930 [Bdellovibrionales bacterium]|nr:hypothetical protein [Bdellovibrionales bacterium]
MIFNAKKTKWIITGTVALGATMALVRCGGGSSSSTLDTSSISSYLASGFAVSSPTASSSSSFAMAAYKPMGSSAEVDPDAPIETKAAAVTALAEGSTCSFTLPNLGSLGARANCYGPNVTYSSHPDGSPTSGTLPGGDLGIWNYTEAGSGEACAVAQLNTISSAASAYIDASLLLQAASICTIKNAGKTAPAEGESLDYTTELAAKIAAPATITSAVVKRTDADTAEFVISGTTDGTKAFSVTVQHNASSTTSYTGMIYGTFKTANKDAFSVEYSRSGDDIKARMLAGGWNTSATDADIFNSSHQVNAGGTFQGNMNHAVLNFNTSTKVGSMSYAWQAGNGDSHTRVFNVYVSGTSGSRKGCGYFGFGDKFVATMASNKNEIKGMICNWAGPGNSHSMTSSSGKAQKQCFTESSGKFVLDTSAASKNQILYWPTNSCDKGGVSVTAAQEGETGSTNNLVTLASDTDYSSYSAPSAP